MACRRLRKYGCNRGFTKIKPLKGVYGNIDGTEIRKEFPEVLRFQCEEVEVLMIHIGGYPGRYSPLAKAEINKHTPKVFISDIPIF